MAEDTKIIYIRVDASKAVDGSTAATRAMEKLERGTSALDSTMSKMEQSLGRVGGYLKANLALMVAEIGARLLQIGKDSLKAAGDLDDLAEQLGITTKGLQALQFAAVQGGMKLEQLETGVAKFSEKIGSAADGSKEMVEALNNIGVKILDVNGKLRPTETLMTEVARAITSMEDPAKRSAAAVDFFGKAGTRMLPMLKDIAGGFEDMAEKARRGGAMISKEAIEKLKELGDAGERSQFKMRALFAENAAGPLTEVLDFITRKLENLSNILKGVKGDWATLLALAATGPSGLVALALSKSPAEKLEKDLAAARTEASAMWDNLGSAQTDRDRSRMMTAFARAQERVGLLERQQGVMNVGGKTGAMPSDPDNIGVSIANKMGGVKNPAVKGAGDDVTERRRKALLESSRELDAAKQFAATSNDGAAAVANLELHFKSLKAAQDVFGKTTGDNEEGVKALTAQLEAEAVATAKLKNLGDFRTGTVALRDQNELMAAELRLAEALPEARAKELATLKTMQEVKNKQLTDNKQDIADRISVLETGEKLKLQADELKRSNELWTAPLQNALNSIQSSTADWIDGLLQGLEQGKVSVADFGKIGLSVVRRMVAELASVAIMRPMLGAVVGGMASIGMVSPATASQLGYGQSPGSSPSGYSMPASSGMMGFMGRPIANTFGRGIDSEIADWSTYGTPQQTGWGMGDVTWGQGIGAAAGVGMGVYQLANAKGNTAKTIGGVGSMVGAGMSLIPGMQIPGMAISMLSAILPSLFGGEEYKWDPLAGANVAYNWNAATGSYGTKDTQQLGGKSIAGQFSGVPTTLEGLYKRTGGKVNPSMAFNAAIWNNQREGKTSAYVISPTQGSNQIGETSGDPSALISRMIGNVFTNMVTNGGLDGVSETLKKALRTREAYSVEEATNLLDLVDAYDQFGKGVNAAKPALDEINTKFEKMTATAKTFGLALEPIEAEQKKQTQRAAQDFIDNMLDPMAVQMRALDDQQRDSLASAEYIRDNVKDVYVDMAKIAEYWTNKRLDIETQYQQQSVGNLQALVRRLTYGDLAAASMPTTMAGARGTYESALAQARAGGTTARDNLAGYAESYATSVRQNFASSAEGAALIDQIRRDLLEVIGSVAGGTPQATGGSTSDNGQTNALLQVVSEQSRMVAALTEKIDRQSDQITALTAQLQRRS